MLLISFFELIPEAIDKTNITMIAIACILIVAFLSTLAEPLGAIIGLVVVHFHPIFNPLFMAFAAGAMIFVLVHELLPMARRYHKIHLFILGMIISVFIYTLLTVVVPE